MSSTGLPQAARREAQVALAERIALYDEKVQTTCLRLTCTLEKDELIHCEHREMRSEIFDAGHWKATVGHQ